MNNKHLGYGLRVLLLIGLAYIFAWGFGSVFRFGFNITVAILLIYSAIRLMQVKKSLLNRSIAFAFFGWAFNGLNESFWIYIKSVWGIEGVYLGLDTFSDWFEFGNYIRGIPVIMLTVVLLGWAFRFSNFIKNEAKKEG